MSYRCGIHGWAHGQSPCPQCSIWTPSPVVHHDYCQLMVNQWDVEITRLQRENEELKRELRVRFTKTHQIRAISMSGVQPNDGKWAEMHFRVMRRITEITDDIISPFLDASEGRDGREEK